MTVLWQIIILMIVLASFFVIIPVWRFRQVETQSDNDIRKEQNRVLFEQNKLELEDDLRQELINAEQFERMKTEIQRAFISDMEAIDKLEPKTVGVLAKRVPLFLALMIPLLSFLLYQQLGSSRELVLPDLIAGVSTARTEEQMQVALENLAIALQDRSQRRPEDIVNGFQLGNIYLRLNRYDAAITTFTELADRMEEDADKATVLGQLSQAMYLGADSEFSAELKNVMDEALVLDPEQYSVLMILAVEAFINQDFAGAVSYWRRQLLQVAPGSADSQMLMERISQVQAMLPAQNPGAGAATSSAITVYVDIDESIKEQIADDMRLFIFARGETMPLPLAAQTFSIAELPVTITLDDSMAMTPQFTLSSTERAYVGASIGRTAIAESGDFRAISETFVVAEQEDTIELLIKDIVP